MKSLLVFITVAVFGSLALADAERGQSLFHQGEAAFGGGRFAEAARLFEDAYAESHRPMLLWNVAQAYRRQYEIDRDLAKLRRARLVYRNYADVATSPAERSEALAAVREVDEQLWLAETNLQDRGRAPPLPLPSPSVSRLPAFSLWGAGLGLAGVGAAFSFAARSEANTVQSTGSVNAPAAFSRVAAAESRGQTFDIVSFAFYGLSAAAVVTGTILFALHRRPLRHAYVAPSIAGAVAGGAW